ncbi:MAG: hypothetical protein AAFZ65_12845 [Planctomycetota bacterium]
MTYRFGPHWTLETGYAHIFTGDVLDDVGLSKDQDFADLQTRFAF